MAVHSDSSRHAAEEAFLRFAGNAVDSEFCRGRFGYVNSWRNVTTDPTENNHLAVCDETSLVAPDDYLASDMFMPGFRLMPSDAVTESVDPVEDDARYSRVRTLQAVCTSARMILTSVRAVKASCSGTRVMRLKHAMPVTRSMAHRLGKTWTDVREW